MTSILATALLAVLPIVPAQSPAVRLEMSVNLRQALERSRFEDGIRTANAPDLDRKLTSSAFGTSPDAFVAAYYFQDELEGQGLGPLHVSVFDRVRRQWVHKQNIIAEVEKLGMMAGGSVLGVVVHPKIVLLDTHVSPSAGFTLVLDRSLDVVTSLAGYRAHVTNEGSIWYFGDMVHFADTHQETLKIFDLARRREFEVFPGAGPSPLAEGYRRQIKAVYDRLPDNLRTPDFDRSIRSVVDRHSASFAFVVGYGNMYLEGVGVAYPRLTTIGRCDQGSTGEWSCSEREITEFARDAGLSVSLDSYGGYAAATLDTLVQAAMDRKP